MSLTNEQIQALWELDEDQQIACTDDLGKIHNSLPKKKMFQFLKFTNQVWPSIIKAESIESGVTFFTDASREGKPTYTDAK